MPMWPFSRRRRNQEGPQPVAQSKPAIQDDGRLACPRLQGVARKNSRRHSRKKRRKSSPHKNLPHSSDKENERPDTNSTSGHEQSSINRALESTDNITALPLMSVLTQSPHLRPATSRDSQIPYNFHLNSASVPDVPNVTGRERSRLQRPQSLRTSDSMLPRRKSTKKRKVDPVREEEIRAMSAPIQIKRPATYSGSILRRDTKKVKDGMNMSFERPTSEVSLPMAESIHSSMSGQSERRGFVISALDVFSARPTLRYSQTQYSPTGSTRVSPPPPILEVQNKDRRDSREKNRIGDLADGMDASSLREMLERDARRREKKKKLDEEKLKRQLERRAEKQRAKEARANEPRKAPETGTLERRPQPQGLGIGTQDTPMTPLPQTPEHQRSREDQDEDVVMQDATVEQVPSIPNEEPPPAEPLAEFERSGIRPHSPIQTPTEEPVIGTAQAIRYSRGSLQHSPPVSAQHTRNISNISHLPDLLSEMQPAATKPDEKAETSSETKKRRSSGASGKRMGVWASIFRRATSSRKSSTEQGRVSPSEFSFSNTSRESMSRQPLPAHLVQPSPSPQPVRGSGGPVRTMSKFREDLPELPISPPASRVQSPELADTIPPVPPLSARRGLKAPANIETQPEPQQQRTPEKEKVVAISPESPTSPSQRTSGLSGLMTRSMASVDSEGSWLSGKPVRRPSRHNYKSGFSQQTNEGSNEEIYETANDSSEEHDIHDDEYFRRLSPIPGAERRLSDGIDGFPRKPSSNALGPSAAAEDQEERPYLPRPLSGDEVLHTSAIARTPTLVRQSNARVKSSEGLVKMFDADETTQSTPSEPEEATAATTETAFQLERAKSVDLGKKHARQVSAGSARILNIKRVSRTSTPPPSGAA